MEIDCRGTAQIRHGETGEIYEIESDELDWDAVGGDERQMGSEIHYDAVIDHPELGELSWGLSEYPIDQTMLRYMKSRYNITTAPCDEFNVEVTYAQKASCHSAVRLSGRR